MCGGGFVVGSDLKVDDVIGIEVIFGYYYYYVLFFIVLDVNWVYI